MGEGYAGRTPQASVPRADRALVRTTRIVWRALSVLIAAGAGIVLATPATAQTLAIETVVPAAPPQGYELVDDPLATGPIPTEAMTELNEAYGPDAIAGYMRSFASPEAGLMVMFQVYEFEKAIPFKTMFLRGMRDGADGASFAIPFDDATGIDMDLDDGVLGRGVGLVRGRYAFIVVVADLAGNGRPAEAEAVAMARIQSDLAATFPVEPVEASTPKPIETVVEAAASELESSPATGVVMARAVAIMALGAVAIATFLVSQAKVEATQHAASAYLMGLGTD